MDEIKLEPKYESILCEGNAEAESIDRKFSTEELADQVKLELQEIKTEQCEDDVKEEDSISVEDQLIDGKGKIWDTNSFSDMCAPDNIKKEEEENLEDVDKCSLESNRDTCSTNCCNNSCQESTENQKGGNHALQVLDQNNSTKTETVDDIEEYSPSADLILKDQKCLHPDSDHPKQSNWTDYITSLQQNITVDVNSYNLNIKRYKCHSCNYRAATSKALKLHTDGVHLKLKNFECDMCTFAAFQKKTLIQHINVIHLKLKDCKCQLCDYSTGTKDNLKYHMDRVHLNNMNEKCNMCQFKTNRKSDLNIHIQRVHLKKRNHKCELCDYRSFKKSVMQLHMIRVHLSIKHLKCDLCKYETSNKQHLKRHVDEVHVRLKKHKCSMCDFMSVRKSNLQKHIIRIHKS